MHEYVKFTLNNFNKVRKTVAIDIGDGGKGRLARRQNIGQGQRIPILVLQKERNLKVDIAREQCDRIRVTVLSANEQEVLPAVAIQIGDEESRIRTVGRELCRRPTHARRRMNFRT